MMPCGSCSVRLTFLKCHGTTHGVCTRCLVKNAVRDDAGILKLRLQCRNCYRQSIAAKENANG